MMLGSRIGMSWRESVPLDAVLGIAIGATLPAVKQKVKVINKKMARDNALFIRDLVVGEVGGLDEHEFQVRFTRVLDVMFFLRFNAERITRNRIVLLVVNDDFSLALDEVERFLGFVVAMCTHFL